MQIQDPPPGTLMLPVSAKINSPMSTSTACPTPPGLVSFTGGLTGEVSKRSGEPHLVQYLPLCKREKEKGEKEKISLLARGRKYFLPTQGSRRPPSVPCPSTVTTLVVHPACGFARGGACWSMFAALPWSHGSILVPLVLQLPANF